MNDITYRMSVQTSKEYLHLVTKIIEDNLYTLAMKIIAVILGGGEVCLTRQRTTWQKLSSIWKKHLMRKWITAAMLKAAMLRGLMMSLVNVVLAGMDEDEKQQMFVELLKECHEHMLWCVKYDKSVDQYLKPCEKLLEYNMAHIDYEDYMNKGDN